MGDVGHERRLLSGFAQVAVGLPQQHGPTKDDGGHEHGTGHQVGVEQRQHGCSQQVGAEPEQALHDGGQRHHERGDDEHLGLDRHSAPPWATQVAYIDA